MPAFRPNRNTGLCLKLSLWIAQGFVSVIFCAFGIMELVMPIPALSHIMPWVLDHPLWFTRSLGVIDVAGGIGIVLPGLVLKSTRLVKYAAIGCASKQVVAILFHLAHGEPNIVPLNLLLLTFSSFVLWSHTGSYKAWSNNTRRFSI